MNRRNFIRQLSTIAAATVFGVKLSLGIREDLANYRQVFLEPDSDWVTRRDGIMGALADADMRYSLWGDRAWGDLLKLMDETPDDGLKFQWFEK